MACPNCGYDNSRNNRFCVRCGVDLAAPPAPPAGSAPPPPNPSDVGSSRPPDAVASPPPNPAPPAPANPWGAPPPPAQWGAPGSAPLPPPPGAAPQASAPPNPFAPPAPYGPYGPPGAYGPPAQGPYGQYPLPYPPSGFQPPATNGLAIASFVLGLVGWVPCGVGSVVAVVLGFVARHKIRESHGRQGGDGLALAGIVLGFLAIAFLIAILVLGAVSNSTTGQS